MIEFLRVQDEIKEILNLESNIVILVKKELNIIGLGKINQNTFDISLFIAKGYRGNGYGKNLIYELIHEAKKINLDKIYVTCTNDDYRLKKMILEVKGVHISTNNNEVKYIIPLNK